jgi:hypothetical protein
LNTNFPPPTFNSRPNMSNPSLNTHGRDIYVRALHLPGLRSKMGGKEKTRSQCSICRTQELTSLSPPSCSNCTLLKAFACAKCERVSKTTLCVRCYPRFHTCTSKCGFYAGGAKDCSTCGHQSLTSYTSGKPGPNRNRAFESCKRCPDSFRWVGLRAPQFGGYSGEGELILSPSKDGDGASYTPPIAIWRQTGRPSSILHTYAPKRPAQPPKCRSPSCRHEECQELRRMEITPRGTFRENIVGRISGDANV